MKLKKIGASILAMAMATSMLAGCGQSASTETPADTQPTEAVETPAAEATEQNSTLKK